MLIDSNLEKKYIKYYKQLKHWKDMYQIALRTNNKDLIKKSLNKIDFIYQNLDYIIEEHLKKKGY